MGKGIDPSVYSLCFTGQAIGDSWCGSCNTLDHTGRRRGRGVQHLVPQKSQGAAEVKLAGNSINMPETVGMARSANTGMHVAAVGAPILQAGAEQKDQAEKANKSEPLLTQGHGVT